MVDKTNDNKIAVKFQEEVFETEIYSIEWQISRRGKLTPVIKCKPVTINGIVI